MQAPSGTHHLPPPARSAQRLLGPHLLLHPTVLFSSTASSGIVVRLAAAAATSFSVKTSSEDVLLSGQVASPHVVSWSDQPPPPLHTLPNGDQADAQR